MVAINLWFIFSCFIIGTRILMSLLNSCQHHFWGICCFNKCFMHFFNFMCLVFHTISTNALLKTEYETSSISNEEIRLERIVILASPELQINRLESRSSLVHFSSVSLCPLEPDIGVDDWRPDHNPTWHLRTTIITILITMLRFNHCGTIPDSEYFA